MFPFLLQNELCTKGAWNCVHEGCLPTLTNCVFWPHRFELVQFYSQMTVA